MWSQLAYQRRRAERLHEAGMCVICGKARTDAGRRTCAVCSAKQNARNGEKGMEEQMEKRAEQLKKYRQRRKERLLEQGLCASCGKKPLIEGLMYCTDCRERNRAKKRNRVQKAKELGMCSRCMKVKAREGYRMCFKCACIESQRRVGYYWKKKAEVRA